MSVEKRPPLLDNGHVILMTAFPPTNGGSSVIMQNLLSAFEPTSFTVVTFQNHQKKGLDVDSSINRYEIINSVRFSGRLNAYWWDIQIPLAVWRLKQLIKRHGCVIVVAVYPFLHTLEIARQACRDTQIPWAVYLHDTITESLSTGRLASRAKKVQAQVFAEAAAIMVMSEGMAQLYHYKYSLNPTPVEHSYPEPIPKSVSESEIIQQQALFAGGIYEINGHSLSRVSRALEKADFTFSIAGTASQATLLRYSINPSNVTIAYYKNRADYLSALMKQELLILALDWPDESSIHPDELATIFPTKTPEYLASGRPILVHCPEHYFLARFFLENNCGFVVSERSIEALIKACTTISKGGKQVEDARQAALHTAQKFSLSRVAGIFQKEIQGIASLKR